MSLEENKAIVRKFFEEVWNNKNLDYIDEIYTPDFKLHALWQNMALGGSGDAQTPTAKQVIGNFEGELDLREYRDEYQEELQRIIDAKIAGEEVVATEEETPPKVVNLMDALRQSLDRVSTTKKKAAKVDMEKAAKVAAPKKRARG